MDSWNSTGGTACPASRSTFDLAAYGLGSNSAISTQSISNGSSYTSRKGNSYSGSNGTRGYLSGEGSLNGSCPTKERDSLKVPYTTDFSYKSRPDSPARRSYKSYTLDDLLGSYSSPNGNGNSLYSGSGEKRSTSYNGRSSYDGTSESNLCNGIVRDNFDNLDCSYKDKYAEPTPSYARTKPANYSSLANGRSPTDKKENVNGDSQESASNGVDGEVKNDDGFYDENGQIVTSYTPQPTTNGCTYIPRTMLGDDKYYYRKMKEVLEARPNKGPPYTPTKLSNFLYIGNIKNAEDFSLLKRLGITHVLNLAGTRTFDVTKSPYPKVTGVKSFLQIAAVDSDTYDMSKHFKESFKFLDKCKQEGGTALVHCNLGINRSGCIAIAWMMVDTKQTMLDICTFVKLKRSVVLCNRSFRRQVIRLAREKKLLDAVPPEDIAICRTEPEKKSSLFNRSFSFGHRRSKSDPNGTRLMSASASDISRLRLSKTASEGGGHYIPNGLLTPSMRRPLRLTASSTALCNPSSNRPAFAEDEEEEEYRIDSRELDTLYEEIEQLQLTSPFSESTTVAIRTPDEPNPRLAALRNNRPRPSPPVVQNSAFLTVPSATSRRPQGTRISQRPKSMYSSTPALPTNYSDSVSEGHSRFKRPNTPPSKAATTDDNPQSYKAFFGSLFHRKKQSDKEKSWRKTSNF